MKKHSQFIIASASRFVAQFRSFSFRVYDWLVEDVEPELVSSKGGAQ